MSTYVFIPDEPVTESLYDLEAIANKTAKPDDLKAAIKTRLLARHAACYREMERYLRAPGVTGSKSFDQGNAVNVLLKHDYLSVNDDDSAVIKVGPIRTMMNATKANEREIWDRLVSTLRDIGMRFKHGRLVGAISIEDQSDDDGAPDIG